MKPGTIPKNLLELIALANALRAHTALQEFTWIDSFLEAATQDVIVDTLLRALPACPHLRKVTIRTTSASCDAMKSLLQLRPATELRLALETDHWLAVTDEIRHGRCNVRVLALGMLHGTISEATEAVKSLASAIQMDRNLKCLLQMEDGYTDEAGVALAEALTVNKTLRKISLSVESLPASRNMHSIAVLVAPVYEALCTMLRVNTSLALKLPPFESDEANERLRESRYQLRFEQRLNAVGRGIMLVSSQMTREQWADALHELNSRNVDDSTAFQVSCLYSMLRSNPTVVRMS